MLSLLVCCLLKIRNICKGGDIINNQNPSQESYISLIFLVILTVLLFFFAKILQITTGAEKELGIVMGEFLRARIQGNPMPPEEARAIYIFSGTVLGIAAIGSFLYFKLKTEWQNFKEQYSIKRRFASEQGTARWESIGNFKKLTGKDGVLIGYTDSLFPQEIRLSQKASCEHIAVIGPTGCGKTSRFFIPNILSIPDNVSLVVTDPKGELERITRDTLIKRGWEVYTFSLDKSSDFSYNPLAIVRDEAEVNELAQITIQNGYSASGQAGDTQWVNFSLPLWEAALFAEIQTAEEEGRLPYLYKAYDFLMLDTEEQVDIVANNYNAYKAFQAYLQVGQAPETMSSIKMVATSSLKLFTRPDIRKATSQGVPFIPNWLREKPVAYFIQIPEHKAHLLKPITATLYWQLFEHLIEKDGLPVFFFLDEFPNIGKIPGFAQLAATLRSRKISINICLQGIEQLAREYSKEEQIDILNNMKTKIYFPGSSGEAGSYFENLVGKSTIEIEKQKQIHPLLTADELRRLPDGYIAVLAHNLNPIILKTIPWYENKNTKSFLSLKS